jgi:hypothetical protein
VCYDWSCKSGDRRQTPADSWSEELAERTDLLVLGEDVRLGLRILRSVKLDKEDRCCDLVPGSIGARLQQFVYAAVASTPAENLAKC